jgi:hypothetical protein
VKNHVKHGYSAIVSIFKREQSHNMVPVEEPATSGSASHNEIIEDTQSIELINEKNQHEEEAISTASVELNV